MANKDMFRLADIFIRFSGVYELLKYEFRTG